MPSHGTSTRQHWSHHRWWRPLFIAYFIALSIGLLWPGLQVPDVVPRPDLIVHGVTFGAFTLLCYLALTRSLRQRPFAFAIVFVIGSIYGASTEWLQSLPFVRRTGAVDDFLADLLGVVIGTFAAWVLSRRANKAH